MRWYRTRIREADWRLDVFAGSTRCLAVINRYLRGEGDIMDEFHRDSVTAGFLCYPWTALHMRRNAAGWFWIFRMSS